MKKLLIALLMGFSLEACAMRQAMPLLLLRTLSSKKPLVKEITTKTKPTARPKPEHSHEVEQSYTHEKPKRWDSSMDRELPDREPTKEELENKYRNW